jgi:hypothetical protein
MTPRLLPPAPAAVRAYFAQRRGSLAELTPEDARHNEWLWLVEVCGLSEGEARAPCRPARAAPGRWRPKMGGQRSRR